MPEAVIDLDTVTRGLVVRRRHFALDAEKRPEHVPDRLTESFGGVLHARSQLGVTAIPWRHPAHPTVVHPPYQHEHHRDHAGHAQQQPQAVVRSLRLRYRSDPPWRRPTLDHGADQGLGHAGDGIQRDLRKHPDEDAAQRQPGQSQSFEPARVVGLHQ